MGNISDMLQDMLPKRTKKRTVKVSEARRILLEQELDKLIGKAAGGGPPKGSLLPEGGGAPIPLSRPYLFAGSTSDCAIPAAGAFVAPRLVLFVREETGVRAVRIGGKFGKVTVNNQDLDNRVLREGDVVSICGKRFQYTEQA